mgnify:FL=1
MSKFTEEELARIRAVSPNGELSEETIAIIEKKFLESEQAFSPLVERMRASRRITAEDLAFMVNVRPQD